MCADTMVLKVIAVTIPDIFLKFNPMRIILPGDVNRKRFEVEAVPFLGISLGFFDFSDHSGVHLFISPF
jgi:hypothetical protein